ncbi:hypothetical protein LTR85_004683 [Meristemomyces frigidus]|nr:hypothetical protein LTR85_004683 [Meristemomyces frigidus]
MEPSTARVFRIITILAFAPTVAFVLPHGIGTHMLCPALGILPMAISACVGLVHVLGKAKFRAVSIAMDIFCACFLIGVLIPSWVFIASGGSWWYGVNAGLVMVGTYGTVPMMVNFMIHTWFVLCELHWRGLFPKKTCPHCNGALGRSSGRAQQGYQHVGREETNASGDGKEASSSVRFMDEEQGGPSKSMDGRPSTDDEAARLL